MGCSTNKSTPQQEGKARKVHLGVRSFSTPEEKEAAAREVFLDTVKELAPAAHQALRDAWQPSALFGGERYYYQRHINPVIRFFDLPPLLEVFRREEDGAKILALGVCCNSCTTDKHITDALAELARKCKAAVKTPHLLAYVDKQQKGYGGTSQKDIDHFRWAVEYQFKGREIRDIASGPGNEQAVDAAVRGVLRLVGLKRRRGKGRPQKS